MRLLCLALMLVLPAPSLALAAQAGEQPNSLGGAPHPLVEPANFKNEGWEAGAGIVFLVGSGGLSGGLGPAVHLRRRVRTEWLLGGSLKGPVAASDTGGFIVNQFLLQLDVEHQWRLTDRFTWAPSVALGAYWMHRPEAGLAEADGATALTLSGGAGLTFAFSKHVSFGLDIDLLLLLPAPGVELPNGTSVALGNPAFMTELGLRVEL